MAQSSQKAFFVFLFSCLTLGVTAHASHLSCLEEENKEHSCEGSQIFIQSAPSEVNSDASNQKYPTIFVRHNFLDPSLANTKAEKRQLTSGLSHFVKSEYKEAFEYFENAIEVYGSPLGYLYASVLSEEPLKIHYQNVFVCAYNADIISKAQAIKHVDFLKDCGFKLGGMQG